MGCLQGTILPVHKERLKSILIIGATTIEQLRADIASVDIELSNEVLGEIETIHTEHPNPCT